MPPADIYQYKSYLFTIAYHMLGEVPAAEDLVQDTFETWLQADRLQVKEVKAYLSRILINKALARLEQVKKQREVYKGVWLPQPLLAEQDIQEEYTLEYALLFLLEKLNPYERAVFVLKEVFAYSHQQIADTLQITPENCRQLLHRAKEKVRAGGRQQPAEVSKQQALLNALLRAMHEKDLSQLEDFFWEDIVMYQDGGGKVAAALKPIYGGKNIRKFLEYILYLEPETILEGKLVWMNGAWGILFYLNSVPDTVGTIEIEGDKIRNLFFIRNPDKIILS
jgi:RNA polymerase sigma-70 factor (ECF subfamily)